MITDGENMVTRITAWLRNFEGLADGELHVDFLPLPARSYTVDSVPCDPVVKKYLKGAYKQYQFVLASREFLASDVRTGTYNLAFYEKFEKWVDGANRTHTLPELGEGQSSHRVAVNSSGYPFLIDEHGTARYQIQLTLFYYDIPV